jgi:hypothetical protein
MKKNILLLLLLIMFTACNEKLVIKNHIDKHPPIYPDYVGVTIPVTIAPLNFTMADESVESLDVVAKGIDGSFIHERGKNIVFSPKEWEKLLKASKGNSITVTVCALKGGEWTQYKDFSIFISNYPIDYGLVYRLIAPGYEVYSKMGIYQRELSSYKQNALYENTLVTGTCVNCHSFAKNNPDHSSLHVRGKNGATIINTNGKSEFLNTKTDEMINSFVYPYWHPSEKYIAYSLNKTRQAFHVIKDEQIEVFDMVSDIVVYKIDTKEVLMSKLLTTSAFETYPCFSVDGKTLFFCTSDEKKIPEQYKEIKYSLCSIAFDPDKGTFGDRVDTLISAKLTNKSVSFPRPSFDGKYILYNLADYGNFPVHHKESDLWLLNLADKSTRRLDELNSNFAESYHSWSSNSHWIVFASRRDGGLYARLYIASIDDKGKVSKPFLLPQKEPLKYYDESVYAYNVAEFVSAPVKWDKREIERGLTSEERTQVKVRK